MSTNNTVDRSYNGNIPTYLSRPLSKKPALIVLLVALTVTLFAFVLSIVPNSSPAEKPIVKNFAGIKGAALSDLISQTVLKHYSIPSDVTSSLILPTDTTVKEISKSKSDSNDYFIKTTTTYNANALITFFNQEMQENGWKLLGKNPKGSSAYQIFGQYPSLDGYYWEAGVTIYYSANSLTDLSLEIFEEPEGG
jgi:hypothetical protein